MIHILSLTGEKYQSYGFSIVSEITADETIPKK